jgi:hypothetical protein
MSEPGFALDNRQMDHASAVAALDELLGKPVVVLVRQGSGTTIATVAGVLAGWLDATPLVAELHASRSEAQRGQTEGATAGCYFVRTSDNGVAGTLQLTSERFRRGERTAGPYGDIIEMTLNDGTVVRVEPGPR